MAYLTLFCYTLLVIFFLSCAFVQSEKFSFTAELIQRDSPSSPFYNASETSIHRLANALQRSAYPLKKWDPMAPHDRTGYQSTIISGDGNYLMRISIGTPPIELFATVGTASNILWIPCTDCSTCPERSQRIFNSLASSTYRNAPCDSRPCLSTSSLCESDACLYTCDKQHQRNCPKGRIATDTITLSSTTGYPLFLPDSSFICGDHIGSKFGGVGTVGLGNGPLSLTSRLHDLIDGQFSYCLVQHGSGQSSKLIFGDAASEAFTFTGALVTPLGQDSDTGHYYVTFIGISIAGNTTQLYSSDDIDYPRRMLIDSATMFTQLPKDYLKNLWKSFSYSLPETISNYLHLDNSVQLRRCFRYSPDFRAPKITLHFLGADLELDESNTFIRVSDDVVCLAFTESRDDDDTSVFGSWQQMNFLMGYDLKLGTLTIEKADCSNIF